MSFKPTETNYKKNAGQGKVDDLLLEGKQSSPNSTGKKKSSKPTLSKQELNSLLGKAEDNLEKAKKDKKNLDDLRNSIKELENKISKIENQDIPKAKKKLPNGYIDENNQPKSGPIPPGVNGTLAIIDFSRIPNTYKIPTQNQINLANKEIEFLEKDLTNKKGLLNGNEEKYKIAGGDTLYNIIVNQRIPDYETEIGNLKKSLKNFKEEKPASTTTPELSVDAQDVATDLPQTADDAAAEDSVIVDTATGVEDAGGAEATEADPIEVSGIDKLKKDLELAIAGKDANSAKVQIENVDDYDIRRLRSIEGITRMLNDPVAFMGNYVWNYDINNVNRLIFRYAFPQNIITGINKKTEDFLFKVAKGLQDKKVIGDIPAFREIDTNTVDYLINSYASSIAEETKEDKANVLAKVINYYFIIRFSQVVRNYLKAEMSPEKFKALDEKLTIDELGGIGTVAPLGAAQLNVRKFNNKYIRYFWLWWNQVFYVNLPVKDQSFIFTVDKNNVVALHAGIYFLERYYGFGQPDISVINRIESIKKARDDSNKIVFEQDDEFFPDGFQLFAYINLNQFTNSNNYFNRKNAPTLEYSNVVNVSNSPFFTPNEELLTKTEKKSLSNAKKVNTCKKSAKNSLKSETSLNLFYKEGNDNVLDKKVPEPGLGCDPLLSVLEWNQAKNIFFDKSTIRASNTRVNFRIPYYNVLGLKTNNMLAPELDIFSRGLEIIQGAGFDEFKYRSAFKGLSTRLLLNVSDRRGGEVLLDNNLKGSLGGNPSLKLASSYFDKYPNWGPQYIIDKIPFFNPQDTPFFQLAMLPYNGAYNVGYQINKKPTNGSDVIQSFYVNAIDGVFASNFEGVDNVTINDSQLSYAKGYSYDVNQVVSFVDISYRYKNASLVLLPTSEEAKELANIVDNFNNFALGLLTGATETPSVKITSPTKSQKVASNANLPITFKFETSINVDFVQFFADIPGGFGKFGPLLATKSNSQLKFNFKVPGKRKVKIQGYNLEGNAIPTAVDTIDIEVVSSQAEADTGIEGSGDAASGEPTPRVALFSFEYSDIIYLNDIRVIETGEVENSVCYVDLPPPAPYTRVYPQRGVGNKLIFSFDNYSQEKSIESKIVPRKYWTEGWEDARQFFLELSDNSPETLKQLGVVSVDNSQDEMYFYRQKISRIKLYASKGEKPKDILELEEVQDINVITDGYTKEIDMEPNVKYYFAAKAVSFTGLESYYSEVYEVELVDDGGTVFPLINVVELEEKRERKKSISLSNKFRIEPALLQQAPNPSKDDVGYLTPSVFSEPSETNPRFKIRLTSKKTGKKVDFNVIYKKQFDKKSITAGDLNLNVVDKSKILVSYKTSFVPPPEPANEEDEAIEIFEEKPRPEDLNLGTKEAPPATKEDFDTDEEAKKFFEMVAKNFADRSTPSTGAAAPTQQSAPTTVQNVKVQNPCCTFFTKAPLFPDTNPKGKSTWAIVEPLPTLVDFNPNEAEKQLNKKLIKINNAIAKLNDDEETVFKVLKSMNQDEKCYMCRRQKEYAGPRSMLAVIQEQFTSSEFDEVLKILNCTGNFGFAKASGGNPKSSTGIELNEGLSAKKCNQKITKQKQTTVTPTPQSFADVQSGKNSPI